MEEKGVMDRKCPRKLDLNAPFLSTRRPGGVTSREMSRASSHGASWDSCNMIPFSWEQIPGKPKDMEISDTNDMVVPPPKLPPGRWHPPKEVIGQANGDHQQHDLDDGCDGDVDEDFDNFSDAIDMFSLSEAIDMVESNVFGVNLEGESSGTQSPSFIIQRFLPDAKALAAASSALTVSKNITKKHPHSSKYHKKCVSRAVRQSYSSPKSCGLDILFPWRMMKNKPCGVKSPVLAPSLNVKPQWGTRHKQSGSLAESPFRSRGEEDW